MKNIRTWIRTHKMINALIILSISLAALGIIEFFSEDEVETRYVLASVEKGTIIASVTGTGQVAALDQVDITARASGNLGYLNVQPGQIVQSGAVIGQIDSATAAFELESARLSYEKLISVDEDGIREAEDDLADAYVKARSTLADTSTDMANSMTDTYAIIDGYLARNSSANSAAKEYIQRAKDSYYTARNTLDDLAKRYRLLSAQTPGETIEAVVDESYEAALLVAQTAKYVQDATVYVRDRDVNASVEADSAYASAAELVSRAHAAVSSLSSVKSTLKTNKRVLADLQAGPDPLDIRGSQLSLRQKEEALAEYSIRAPFVGIIASVKAKQGERINSGATIATLMTTQKIAEISLNEIDAAKVSVGQKATLTFDALEYLSISGEVLEVDMIGTVNQGVVNYAVKIAFDTDDDRVKPGMTVSAHIITDMKQDVLTVPLSALKSQGSLNYVEVVNELVPEDNTAFGVVLANAPSQAEVVIGLSNDESVEIVSGLEEGQRYVVRTAASQTTSSSQSSTPSLFGGTTRGNRSAGGAVMFSR